VNSPSAKTKPLYVCGPTASGKSGLSIELARKFDGEIVNADAFQIYIGLEILSAAPTREELACVPHHLYGVLEPDEPCDAMRYREMAMATIEEIQSRGKTPIVTGGSGMYLKFLTHGPSPVPSADETLRAELEKESDEVLAARLTTLDPDGAAATNLKNRRYVIRALEICILTGSKMSEVKSHWKQSSDMIESMLRGVYLVWDRETLRQRINRRTEMMLDMGAVDEVAALGVVSATCEKAIGVSHIRALLAGELTREECGERIAAATRQYAKRQRTWFGKEKWLQHWNVDESTSLERLAEQIISHA